MTIDVRMLAGPTPEAQELVDELETYLQSRGHAAAQRHGFDMSRIFQPDVRFFLAFVDGGAVGCGGVALCDGFAELKRMYVRPAYRGADVAGTLIRRLEDEALAHGRSVVRLETGDWLVRARRSYARQGYRECTPFPPYAQMPAFNIAHSVFMEKLLAG